MGCDGRRLQELPVRAKSVQSSPTMHHDRRPDDEDSVGAGQDRGRVYLIGQTEACDEVEVDILGSPASGFATSSKDVWKSGKLIMPEHMAFIRI